MSKLRRLLLCSALLAGIVLLGAQALGMLTAHRHLSRQLAQQSESGARTLAWVLGRAPPLLTSVRFWLTNCTARGCTHVSGLPTRHPATAWIAARTPPRTPPRTPAQAPARTLVLPARAGGLAPYASPDGAARTVTVQGDATLANDTLWQGGVRAVGLALSAGLFWALFAISRRAASKPARRATSASACALAPGADASPSGSCGLESVDRPWSTPAAGSTPRSRSRTRGSSRCKARSTATPSPAAEPQVFHGPFPRGAERPDRRGGRPPAHVPPARPAQINRHLSRAFTDQWLRSSADRLRRLVDAQGGSQALLARIGGSDFALLMPRSAAACWPSACAASCARYACRWASTAGAAGRWPWLNSRPATA